MKNVIFLIAIMVLPGVAIAELSITNGWATRPVAGVKNAAGYMQLTNTGHNALQVVAVHCEMAKHCQLHQVIHDQGIVRMRLVPKITVLPNAMISLEPGGLHLMVMGIMKAFHHAQFLPIELELETGDRIHAELQIRDMAQQHQH